MNQKYISSEVQKRYCQITRNMGVLVRDNNRYWTAMVVSKEFSKGKDGENVLNIQNLF